MSWVRFGLVWGLRNFLDYVRDVYFLFRNVLLVDTARVWKPSYAFWMSLKLFLHKVFFWGIIFGGYRNLSSSQRYDVFFYLSLWMGKDLYMEEECLKCRTCALIEIFLLFAVTRTFWIFFLFNLEELGVSCSLSWLCCENALYGDKISFCVNWDLFIYLFIYCFSDMTMAC